MATTPAGNIQSAILLIGPNVIGLHAPSVDLVANLQIWKDEFFATLDPGDTKQALIYQWIAPTTLLLQNLLSRSRTYIDDYARSTAITDVVFRTLIATSRNGYSPPAAQDAAMTVAFNNSWT